MYASNNEHMESNGHVEPVIVNGPVTPGVIGPIYQVTLPTGAILTNPGAFPADVPGPREVNPYIAEDGRLLI